MQMVTLIAAIGKNNELGKNNDLLWHLPTDFRRFKTLTTGHTIIMGRKTFESLPGVLPNRKHIIVTRNKNYTKDNIIVVNSLQEALENTKEDPQPFIIGGGEIYTQALPLAQKMELTKVHATFEADTYFPEFSLNEWQLITSEKHLKDNKHAFDFTFETWARKTL